MKKIFILIFIVLFSFPAFAKRVPLDDKWDFLAKDKTDFVDFPVLQKKLLEEINKLRFNPQDYGTHYKTILLENHVGKKENFNALLSITKGNPQVLESVTAYLDNITGALDLIESPELTKAAADHVNDIGPKGIKSHVGSDGQRVAQRVRKYVNWKQHVTEVLVYGYPTVEELILYLLTAKGSDSDENRQILMSRVYTKIGVACGVHQTEQVMCDIILAVDVEPKTSSQTNSQPNVQAVQQPKTILALE
ncbi:CAP domain-containing protein [bacterium]|nr:CAP domain-containing protein [bacterium]